MLCETFFSTYQELLFQKANAVVIAAFNFSLE